VNSNCRYRCLNCQTTTSCYNLRHWDEWLRSPETPMSARRYFGDIRKKEHSRSPLETSRIWFCDGHTRSRSGMNWSLLVFDNHFQPLVARGGHQSRENKFYFAGLSSSTQMVCLRARFKLLRADRNIHMSLRSLVASRCLFPAPDGLFIRGVSKFKC
jgi:hypothetical protein